MLEALASLVGAVLALDQTLARLAVEYGPWLYALLFAVIFAETGLVVTPFLPGDSLLFVAGTVAAGAGAVEGRDACARAVADRGARAAPDHLGEEGDGGDRGAHQSQAQG